MPPKRLANQLFFLFLLTLLLLLPPDRPTPLRLGPLGASAELLPARVQLLRPHVQPDQQQQQQQQRAAASKRAQDEANLHMRPPYGRQDFYAQQAGAYSASPPPAEQQQQQQQILDASLELIEQQQRTTVYDELHEEPSTRLASGCVCEARPLLQDGPHLAGANVEEPDECRLQCQQAPAPPSPAPPPPPPPPPASSVSKMNPLDVSFLLYTRQHRDLARLAAAAAAAASDTPASSNQSAKDGGLAQLQCDKLADFLVSASDVIQLSNEAHHSFALRQASGREQAESDAADEAANEQDLRPEAAAAAAAAATTTTASSTIQTTPTTISNPSASAKSVAFNSSLPIKIIIHGFGSGGRRRWVTDMVCRLLDFEDANVIVVDWERGAALLNYVQAAGNTRFVGHQIAQLIRWLNFKFGLTGDAYHLIGFSLGAHVAGFAGMEIRNSSQLARHWINRITGLDPASLLFEGYDVHERLDPSDAQFVDVIHSNGDGVLRGGFGSLQPMGHVDFYPNGGRVQVGCNSVLLAAFSDIIYQSDNWKSLCNHRRALYFFMDSFEQLAATTTTTAAANQANAQQVAHTRPPLTGGRCRFRAFNCDSYESFLRGHCFHCGPNHERCSNMGYSANRFKGRGKMYLTTHEEAPFCANQFLIRLQGAKGSKNHWGKVEVTLVSVDGKNETFWLTSMSTTTTTTSGSGLAHTFQGAGGTNQISNISTLTPPPPPPPVVGPTTGVGLNATGSAEAGAMFSTLSPAFNALGAQASTTGGQQQQPLFTQATNLQQQTQQQTQLNQQQSMQSLIVAHLSLSNLTHVLLRYTRYKGWLYSGDESWPIDKVLLVDSDGRAKSFCGHNTILESHITTRLKLEPGNCTVIATSAAAAAAGAQPGALRPPPLGGALTTSQPSTMHDLASDHQQQQQQQQVVLIGARQPRLFGPMLHEQGGAAMQPLLIPQAYSRQLRLQQLHHSLPPMHQFNIAQQQQQQQQQSAAKILAF